MDMGVQLGFVQKSGSWFSMGEMRIGQGRDAARQFLKDNPDIAEKLEADIRENAEKLMPGKPAPRPISAPAAPVVAPAPAPRTASRAIDVSAEDFEDADR